MDKAQHKYIDENKHIPVGLAYKKHKFRINVMGVNVIWCL